MNFNFVKKHFISVFLIVAALTNSFSQAPVSAPAPSGQSSGSTTQGMTSSSGEATTTPDKGKATITTEKGKATANDKKSSTTLLQKGDDGEQNDVLEDEKEDQKEIIRQQKLSRLRGKIFGTQIFNNDKLSFAPSTTIATPRDYTIGPGDELLVYIYGYSQKRFTLTVNNDGFVFVEPSVAGAIQLSGRTIEQAQKELIVRLAPHYNGLGMPNSGSATSLQITLGRIRNIRVTVLGEVITPGTYSVSSLSTALNVLYETGGPNEIGTFRDIKVVRKNEEIAKLDLYELLMNGSLSGDIRLQDNDVIKVGVYDKRVELLGNFKRPGIYELSKNEVLTDAIRFAGGFAQDAYSDRLKVIGITPKERKITDVRSENFAKYVPSNGDEVTSETILKRYENMVTLNGAVYRPGEFSLDQNKTLLELIKNADGLKGDAFVGRVTVARTREDLSIENITLNLTDIINKKVDDLVLQREDVVTVYSKFELREGADIGLTGDFTKGNQRIPYTSNLTLEDAILMGGGFRESAANAQVDVVRRKKDVDVKSSSAQISNLYTFNINRDLTLDANESRFALEPYDEIIIRTASNYQPQTFVRVEGEVVSPGVYGIKNKDEKLSDLIKRAGGLTAQAYVPGATLIRQVQLSKQEQDLRLTAIKEVADDAKKGAFEVEDAKPESIGISLEKILDNPGEKEDIIVEDGDVIRVPKRLETVRVQGEVLFPTTIKYRGGSFKEYISQSGGFQRTSLRRKSYVIYPNGMVASTHKFLFFNIYPKVQPGSEIIVPFRTASDLLEVQKGINTLTNVIQGASVLLTTIFAFKLIK